MPPSQETISGRWIDASVATVGEWYAAMDAMATAQVGKPRAAIYFECTGS